MSKRILSVILMICMLLNNMPVAAFAEEVASGCTHVCDESCGFAEAVACDLDCPAEGAHAEGCAYRAGADCTHQHNGDCGAACTHVYADGVCTVCGETQPCAHTGGTATCEALAVCEACGESYGELTDHVYGEEGICACGDECEHDYAEGICTVCGMEEPQPKCGCTVKCVDTGSETCEVCKADLTQCVGAEPETEAPAVIIGSDWEWIDEEEIYNTDRKVLELAGVGSWEDVQSMLPAAIRLAEGTEVAVTWEKGDFAEVSGTYTLKAILPEGYVLEDGTNALSLTLEMAVDSAEYDAEPHSHCICGGATAADHTCANVTWTAWGDDEAEKTSMPSDGGNYYLVSDVTLSSTWYPNKDNDFSLCLNGKTLQGKVSVWNKMTLCDCNGEGTGKIVKNSDHTVTTYGGTFIMYSGVLENTSTDYTVVRNQNDDSKKGKFTMHGGTIKAENSRGVYVSHQFTMNGGTITGSISGGSPYGGGGVYVDSNAEFTMNGGTITGHTSGSGGGVYVGSNSTFSMNNGTITDSSALNGGGVYISGGAQFTMENSSITGNITTGSGANGTGGGICASSGATVTITNSVISGNKAYTKGGGIYISGSDSSKTLTLDNTVIENNTAAGDGGGVYASGVTVTIQNGCKINENISGGTAGGVYLGTKTSGVRSSVSDAEICDNIGGGLYLYSASTAEKYVNLSGNIKIEGNTASGAPKNLYLRYVSLNVLPSMSTANRIGLSGLIDSYYKVLSANGHNDYVTKFISEEPCKKITTNADGALIYETETNVPTGIVLDQTSLTLEEGESATLTATVSGEEGCQNFVTWSSSDTTVATVDGTGKVTAIGPGTATITAKTVNNFPAECQVRVTAAAYYVTELPEQATLFVDGNEVAADGKIATGETVSMQVAYEEVNYGIQKSIPTVTDANEQIVAITLTEEDTEEQTHTYTFKMPESNIVITAEEKWASLVSSQVLPSDNAGSVTILPSIAVNTENVALAFAPAEGYEFVSWKKVEETPMPSALTDEDPDSSDKAEASFVMGSVNTQITATFRKIITDVKLYRDDSQEPLAAGAKLELGAEEEMSLLAELGLDAGDTRKPTWTSSDPTVATVALAAIPSSVEGGTTETQIVGYQVVVKPTGKLGTTTITATADGVSETCKVTVVEKYDLWVGGVQVTSDNKDNIDVPGATGSAKYDPTNNTLTLENFSYTGQGYEYQNSLWCAAIYSKNELTVKVVGSNTVTASVTGNYTAEALKVRGALTITGDSGSSLTLTGAGRDCVGCYGNLKIENVTVNATGYSGLYSDEGNITINNAEVTATATTNQMQYAAAIYAQKGNITIENSTVTANAPYANAVYSYTSDLYYTIKNSNVTISAAKYGIGLTTGTTLFVENSTLTITATEKAIGALGGNDILVGNHVVYAGDTAPGALVESPDETTYASKYVKIAPITYTVTISDEIANGTVTVSAAAATEGSTVKLKVAADQGYNLTGLSVVTDGDNGASVEVTPLTGDADGYTHQFTVPATAVTVSAAFEIITYNIHYDLDGGTETENPNTYTVESETITLKAPTKEGYTFLGWTDGNSSEPRKNVTISAGSIGNREYTAHWSVNDYTYHVIYKSSSGLELRADTVTKTFGGSYTIDAPAVTGYSVPASQTIAWDSTTPKTITFTYEPIAYTVRVNRADGSEVAISTYTIESETITLDTPDRTGYTFIGWTDGNDQTPETTVQITKGSTGNKTYTACWLLKSATVTTGEGYTGTYDGNGHEIRVEATHELGDQALLSYQWYKGGKEEANKITGATAATWSVTDVADSGKYYCQVGVSDGEMGTADWSEAITVSISKADSQIAQAPKAVTGLVYTGAAQALITVGDTADGTVKYRLEEENSYSDTVPTAVTAGNHTVWYYVAADDNHTDSQPKSVTVTISRAPATFTVKDSTVEKGQEINPVITSDPANIAHKVIYRRNGVPVEPAEVGEYDIYLEITDDNYRHATTTDGAAIKLGVLRIYENEKPAEYTLSFGANGGTGTMADLEALTAGTVRLLPDCGFTAPKDSNGNDKVFAGWSYGGAVYQPGAIFSQPGENATLQAIWETLEYSIGGTVTQNSQGIQGAKITLKLGGKTVVDGITTNEQGEFTIGDCLRGTYNLVAEFEGITQTVKVVLDDRDVVHTIQMPAGKIDTVVEVASGTPDVVVGGLDKTLSNNEKPILNEDDKEALENGGRVEIKMQVSAISDSDAIKNQIISQTNNKTAQAELYLDLTLTKTTFDETGTQISIETIGDANTILENIIHLPGHLQNRDHYHVFRQHNGNVEKMERLEKGTTDKEGFVVNGDNTISIFAWKYSTYAIVSTENFTVTFDPNGGTMAPTTVQTNADNQIGDEMPGDPERVGYKFLGWFTEASGGTEVVKTTNIEADTTVYAHWKIIDYKVNVVPAVNGVVTGSVTTAHFNDQVAITVAPNHGYQLSTLTVVDENGAHHTLGTDNNGKYVFTMPAANVTVTAAFSAVRTYAADTTNPKTGDDFQILFWSSAMMLSALGILLLLAENKKKQFVK